MASCSIAASYRYGQLSTGNDFDEEHVQKWKAGAKKRRVSRAAGQLLRSQHVHLRICTVQVGCITTLMNAFILFKTVDKYTTTSSQQWTLNFFRCTALSSHENTFTKRIRRIKKCRQVRFGQPDDRPYLPLPSLGHISVWSMNEDSQRGAEGC